MAKSIFTNNAATTLANPVSAVDTSIVLVTGTGSIFPTPTGGDYFYITCVTATSTYEIMKVTARTSDTLTVVRAQEGTTALVFNNGDRVELRVTAASLNNMLQSDAIGTTVQAYNTTLAGIAAGTTTLGGFKNKIINGKMDVAQRGTSFPAINDGVYSLDRWLFGVITSAAFTVSQQADVPNGNEFQNSLRVAVTTADTSIAAGDLAVCLQRIEGYNVRDLIGRDFTLSFRVRSSKTGIHCVAFRNSTSDRSYVMEYTINTANTWETKSVTVPGGLITAGTWNWTNGIGLQVSFALAAGSTFQTTANAWQTGNFVATANQVNCLDTIGNIFAITGVQLEAGSVATPFEHRPYGAELALCQRFYQVINVSVLGAGYTTGINVGAVQMFAVQMRGTPTMSANTAGNSGAGATTVDSASSVGFRYYASLTSTGGHQINYAGTASAEL